MYQQSLTGMDASRPMWGRAINTWFVRFIIACIALALTASPALGQITLQETVTGGTDTNTSPWILPLINGGADQTYVLAIGTRFNRDVFSVAGGSLTWIEQIEQCGTDSQSGMRIWTAQGSPAAPFQVQITWDAAAEKPLTAILSRYSGVGFIIDPTGENPDGENGSCSNTTKNKDVLLTLTSAAAGSVHVVALNSIDKTVDSFSPGYSLNGSGVNGTSDKTTNVYLYHKQFNPAATDTFQATLTNKTWWSAAGVVLVPPITLEETVTGGSANTSPVTLPLIVGGTDMTYVLAIATKWNNDVTAVTGGGLTWIEQVQQCATGNKTAMRIWTAQGSPAAPFQVQITYNDGLPLTAILSRYSGVGSIIDPTGENPAGESGLCSDGSKTNPAQLTLTSTDNGSVHVLGVAPADQTVSSASPGYTLTGSDAFGSGGNITRAYMYDNTFDPAATDTFQATLTGNTWWATGGVVLSPGPAPPPPDLFTDVSTALGFDVKTNDGKPSGLNFADFDNDGDLDAIITGNKSARIFTNINQGQSFTETKLGGGDFPGQGAMIDIDNDGDIDFWHNKEKLFENDGSASFNENGSIGFSDASSTSGVAAADIDADGYTDLLMFSKNGNWIGFHSGRVAEALDGTDDPSYGFNDSGTVGDGGFCASGDVNNDGRLDFYYHYKNGQLFLSNADGTYTQNAGGISVDTNKDKPVGAAFADYDNDGDLDLFVSREKDGEPGYLWRNDAGTFTNVTAAAGITNSSKQRGCAWGDYDNDGDLDLYIAVKDDDNVLYQNQGDGTFLSVSPGASVAGKSQDALFVDYDNDGDLDLAVTQEDDDNVLLQNSTDDTNYLKVRVLGHGRTMTNTAAIGVRVDLYAADGTTFLARREIATARGFGGTEPIWVHFGGVTNTSTYVVKVHFVGGVTEVTLVPQIVSTTIGSVTIAQMLTVVEGNPRLAGWREVEPD